MKLFARIILVSSLALAAMVANVVWGREAELPDRLLGIDTASLNSTGQWVNVEHKDWKRAKVVRSASGKAEKLVLRSRDLSQEWSEAAREEFLMENLSELPKVGRNCTCFSMDAHGPMRKSWFANSGLAGEFRFKEGEDGQKVLDLSVRLMSDDEWAAWVKENGEPPKQVPQATEFPDTLLGVKIPKTASQEATLCDGCIEVEGVKARYWREEYAPLDHPLFTHSHNEYSLRTKTTASLAFSRKYPGAMTDGERKAVEDEVLKLARADGFDCEGAVNRVSADKEPGAWRFQLDAVRPDGIRLSAYVWRHPEEMRKRLGLPDECELRAVVSLPDGLLPQIKNSRLWREGREEQR